MEGRKRKKKMREKTFHSKKKKKGKKMKFLSIFAIFMSFKIAFDFVNLGRKIKISFDIMMMS